MIRLAGISKVHRTDDVETTALRDIDLTVGAGEFLAIMGPSGCGKSTLLNILGLMDTPSAGQYFLDDEAVAVHREARRAELRKRLIGVIFQSFNLIDELTVYQNVELALLYQKVPREERKQRVQEVLQRVAVEHRRNHYPQQLSGGQQQRVAIARAIVGRPRLLLADEPTGNLDSRNGDEVMAELKLLNQEGTTVVMVTHSEEYATFGSRIVRMLDGAILQESVQAEAV